MKRSLLSLLLLSQISQSSIAEPPPAWAKDATEALESQGIIQGYPDGTVDGQRPATRDEFAEMIERLDNDMTQEQEWFLDRDALKATQDDTTSLSEEINELKARTEALENRENQVEQRKGELNRPSL